MAAVHGQNTKPEMLVRSGLFQAGYRFLLHRRNLPGSPDIVCLAFAPSFLYTAVFGTDIRVHAESGAKPKQI
jgi:G:T-mismatch repair DNA endonuclease (very short patch repair protein)